jgi:hypothetical protein
LPKVFKLSQYDTTSTRSCYQVSKEDQRSYQICNPRDGNSKTNKENTVV